jgi:hypothetical protein
MTVIKRSLIVGLLVFAFAVAGICVAAGQRGIGADAAGAAIIADDPPFATQRLILTNLPTAAATREALFNENDLTGWDVWLGPADSSRAFADMSLSPIGLNKDTNGVFSVVTDGGRPAIRTAGTPNGALITKREYGNYHLRLEFKWGAPRTGGGTRNSGVLYHSHGAYGAFLNSWMQSMEFQLQEHSQGMLIPVGSTAGRKGIADADWRLGATVAVGQDSSLPYPMRRFMVGGRKVAIAFPAYNVQPAINAEKPAGEWNTIELYTFLDRSIHVVNGVPVLEAEALTTSESKGMPTRPLTRGRIQLESEGAEAFFRNITIEPINQLPRIEVQ